MARAGALGGLAGTVLGTALGATLPAARAAAQQTPGAPTPSLRPSVAATVIAAAHPLGLAGAGLEADAGLYTRFGLAAAVGAAAAGGGRAVGELAATTRFLFDPLRQSSRGVYATGGLALRVAHAATPRLFVLAGLGVEGRPRGRFIPALEAGLGGGARLSLVLRPARPGRR